MLKAKRFAMFLCMIVLSFSCITATAVSAATTYQATWASVDQHTSSTDWFKDAKFGIWFHWGAYSVPAYGSEWYPRNMYFSGSSVYNNHVSLYGDPYSVWPYQNFINGAYDKSGVWKQFAPKLVSNGGSFDPNAWAQLFADSGAKIGGIMGEHHDGFSMWNSTVNPWNAVAKGPKLDLVGQLAAAYRSKNLKVMISDHSAYNFNGYYEKVPAQTDPSLQMLYGQLPKAQEEQLWYDKLKEIIDGYQPDYIWNDTNVAQISEQQRLNLLSYYYNKGIDWNKQITFSYNDGYDSIGSMAQFERGGPSDITSNYWMGGDSISASSWCYTNGMTYYTYKALLDELIDRTSKNGTFCLNIAPKADGSIPTEQQNILLGIGNWLKVYGEAIYSTIPWVTYGEGPTNIGGGSFTGPTECTAADIRFTTNKAKNTLYATDMGWPSNNQMVITTLKSGAFSTSTITGVSLIGGGALTWSQDSTGLKVNLPSTAQNTNGVAIKITFSGSIPTMTQLTLNDSNVAITYSGTWGVSSSRGLGDVNNDVHSSMANNDYFSYTFNGTGVDFITEKNSDEGNVGIYIDGVLQQTVSCYNASRLVKQTVYSKTGLTNGMHTIKGVKTSGTYINVDAFNVYSGSSASTYKLMNVNSRKVLGISGGSTGDGANTLQWSDTGTGDHVWYLSLQSNGYYKIFNQNSSKVLGISGASTADGAQALQWSDTGTADHEWQLTDMGGGNYKIVNHNSGKSLAISGGSTADGGNAIQWTDNGGNDQRWRLITN